MTTIQQIINYHNNKNKLLLRDLTHTQLGVLEALATGASNQEIAEKLGKTKGAIAIHVSNIFIKLGSVSRKEAILIYEESKK